MYPTIEQAHHMLEDAARRNPGAWDKHSRLVARCAEKIAAKAGLNPQKAYVLGLLHDIGRRFGVTGFAHVVDGYDYLHDLGYDEAARVCLTHSFSTHNIDDYCGKIDVEASRFQQARERLNAMVYDDYDRLIQLCDCLAGTEITDMETRMRQVETRHGRYPREKWDMNLRLKAEFDAKTGGDIDTIIR